MASVVRSTPVTGVVTPTRDDLASAPPVEIANAITALQAEFDEQFPPQIIADCVALEAARFRHARISTYLPILIHKAAREQLRSLLRSAGGGRPADGQAAAAPLARASST